MKKEYIKNLLYKQEIILTKENIKLTKAVIKAKNELFNTNVNDERKEFLKKFINKSEVKIENIEKEVDLIQDILKNTVFVIKN